MQKWFEKNGFDANGVTYVYYPDDSYSVKDQLKEDGFVFSKNLLWHKAEVPAGYEDKVVKVEFDEIGERAAWGEGFYSPSVRATVDAKLSALRPAKPQTEFYGAEGDRIVKLMVHVDSFKLVQTKYGYTNLINFSVDNYKFQWWTNSQPAIEEDTYVPLTARIKKHNAFGGVNYTVITRATFKN